MQKAQSQHRSQTISLPHDIRDSARLTKRLSRNPKTPRKTNARVTMHNSQAVDGFLYGHGAKGGTRDAQRSGDGNKKDLRF